MSREVEGVMKVHRGWIALIIGITTTLVAFGLGFAGLVGAIFWRAGGNTEAAGWSLMILLPIVVPLLLGSIVLALWLSHRFYWRSAKSNSDGANFSRDYP